MQIPIPRRICTKRERGGEAWRDPRHLDGGAALRPFLTTACLLLAAYTLPGISRAAAQEAEPPPDAAAEEEEKPLPGDWAVALLDKISNSSGYEAREDLLRAVMRAGPGAIPMLEPALQDDRTAEFAAQALAYIGGEKALKLLWGLTTDRRDLNLRRFYYGALAEFDAPQATETLIDVIKNADAEPDWTVTEFAIVALTVRSDPKILPPLREAMENTQDIVIRLDLENAIEVIERRSKLLASGEVKSGGSVEYAVRSYFAPALETPPASKESGATASRGTPARGAAPKKATGSAPSQALPEVHIQSIALSPDQTRALANVVFEVPSASATYDFVLQKRFGEWVVASVWLGKQAEKTLPVPNPVANPGP